MFFQAILIPWLSNACGTRQIAAKRWANPIAQVTLTHVFSQTCPFLSSYDFDTRVYILPRKPGKKAGPKQTIFELFCLTPIFLN